MTEKNFIGGYFSLNLSQRKNYYGDAVFLNTARSCIRYIVRAFNIKEIYIPYYTCPIVWQTLKNEKCEVHFYHINKNFYPEVDLPSEAYIIYTNYFGVCANNVKKLSKKYHNLIVDNAQAFYMPKFGIASFNSVRKFFPTADGAILYTDKKLNSMFEQDISYKRYLYILRRTDTDYISAYNDFIENEKSLNSHDILYMSELTKNIIDSIDIKQAAQQRINNFKFLNKSLKNSNKIAVELSKDDVPMYYPYLVFDKKTEKSLLEQNIYVERLWNSLPENTQEGIFQKHLLLLPIDQRYNEKDMQRIINIIEKVK